MDTRLGGDTASKTSRDQFDNMGYSGSDEDFDSMDKKTRLAGIGEN